MITVWWTLGKGINVHTEIDSIGDDGEGIQIEEGEIDFNQLMPLYQDFDGPIVTEIWRGHEKGGKGFKLAAERLSNYL